MCLISVAVNCHNGHYFFLTVMRTAAFFKWSDSVWSLPAPPLFTDYNQFLVESLLLPVKRPPLRSSISIDFCIFDFQLVPVLITGPEQSGVVRWGFGQQLTALLCTVSNRTTAKTATSSSQRWAATFQSSNISAAIAAAATEHNSYYDKPTETDVFLQFLKILFEDYCHV